jgi:outer membrane autotransporter protein
VVQYNGGTLTVSGAQALGFGDVRVNGGILRAVPQSINVKGNYIQNAGGTLQLQVAGANPGQYGTLNVSGNAALGGTLQLLSLGFQPWFQPRAGEQLTLVTTGGVVSGRFAQFLNPFAAGPGFNTVDLVYGRNSVVLEFLNPTSPAGLTAFYEISFSNANIQRLNLEGRLDDLRSGSNGFSSNMKFNGATVSLEDEATVDGKSSKSTVEQVLQSTPENRWGVWVTGFGDFVNIDADSNANGYDFTTGGVSLGVDYRITHQLAIGLMGEYAHTWTSLQSSGDVDVNSGRGGVYANTSNCNLCEL